MGGCKETQLRLSQANMDDKAAVVAVSVSSSSAAAAVVVNESVTVVPEQSSTSAWKQQHSPSQHQPHSMEYVKVEKEPLGESPTTTTNAQHSPVQEHTQQQHYQNSSPVSSRDSSVRHVGGYLVEQNAASSPGGVGEKAVQYAQPSPSDTSQQQQQPQPVIYGSLAPQHVSDGAVITHDPNVSDHSQGAVGESMGAVYQHQQHQHQQERGSPPHVSYSTASPPHHHAPPHAHGAPHEHRVIYEATPVSESSYRTASPVTYTSLAPEPSAGYKEEEYVVSNGTVQKMSQEPQQQQHRSIMLAEPNVAPVPTPTHGHTSPHVENCPTPTHVTELTPVQPAMYSGQPPFPPHVQITLQQHQQYQGLRNSGAAATTNPIMSSEDVERYLNHVEQPPPPPSSSSVATSHESQLTPLTPSTSHSYSMTHQFDSYHNYLQGNFVPTSRGIPAYYSPSPSPVSWTPTAPDTSQASSYNSSALQNMTQRFGYPPTPDLAARGTGSSSATDGPSSFSSGAGARSPSGLVNYSGYQPGQEMTASQIQNGRADWPLTHLLTSGGSQPGSMSPTRRSTPAPEVRPGE